MKRSYIREILDAINEKTISFAGGLPNENLFPINELKNATNKVLENRLCLQYSKSQGNEDLREKIAKIYCEKFDFETSKDEILITTGSQQTFDIISKIFVKDEIFVQSPTYIGALSAFKMLKLDVKSFEDFEDLKQKLHQNSAVYLMSDFSNPTVKSYSNKQRDELLKIFNKNSSFIIEDGAYSLLSFDGKINRPISAEYENSFHLGSFSKIVAPGFRVGWIRAKKEFIDKILVSKESLDLHTSTFNQMILNQYLEDNDLDLHLEKIRDDYKNRMFCMSYAFKRYLPSFSFENSLGGMFIYGKFEEDSMILAKKALEHNIAFVPATVFYSDERVSTEARFNFTNSSFEQIEEGIKRLSEIV